MKWLLMFPEVTTSLLLLFAIGFHNWKRAQLQEVKELIPNRLLTAHPLVFVSGKRSFFYFLAYWNAIPHWLASHGYEVFHLNLAWKNPLKRQLKLKEFFEERSKSQQKMHLVIDLSSYLELSKLLSVSTFDCLASITLIGSIDSLQTESSFQRLSQPIEELELPIKHQKSPLFWKLHLIWTGQSLKTSLACLGWKFVSDPKAPAAERILDRAQFLAERDLLQRSSSLNVES